MTARRPFRRDGNFAANKKDATFCDAASSCFLSFFSKFAVFSDRKLSVQTLRVFRIDPRNVAEQVAERVDFGRGEPEPIASAPTFGELVFPGEPPDRVAL